MTPASRKEREGRGEGTLAGRDTNQGKKASNPKGGEKQTSPLGDEKVLLKKNSRGEERKKGELAKKPRRAEKGREYGWGQKKSISRRSFMLRNMSL